MCMHPSGGGVVGGGELADARTRATRPLLPGKHPGSSYKAFSHFLSPRLAGINELLLTDSINQSVLLA